MHAQRVPKVAFKEGKQGGETSQDKEEGALTQSRQ